MRTSRSICLLAGLLSVAVVAAAGEPYADDSAVFTGDRALYYDVDMELTGALFRGEEPPASTKRADLVLYMGFRPSGQSGDAGGKWKPHFIGWAGMRRDHGPLDARPRRYSHMDHEGTIETVRTEGDRTILEVKVLVHPDPWTPGGRASYTLTVERKDDAFVGTYEGTFKGKKVSGKARGTIAETLWPAPVKDWTPLEKGEHPRLMFRAGDVEALRKRAKTPTGKKIVARLRYLLGGGEQFPTDRSNARGAYGKGRRVSLGGYTISHGTGYGMLYQLTGEKKYAALARRAVELSFRGVRDRDQRYSWRQPGGKLRAGPSYAQIAYAYDLCYDAWEPDFRKKVAGAIQAKVFKTSLDAADLRKAMAEPSEPGLIFNTAGGQHSPHSNHYGAWNGGAGVAILAILGDEGADDRITYRAHRVLLQRAERALEVGYGDSAWFFEGHHGGRLNYNTGLAEYLQCLRNAAGLHLVGNFPGGKWLTTKWVYELTRRGRKLISVHKGIYAGHGFSRGGWSSAGDFSIGFGNVPEAHKPVVLWFYNHVVEPKAPENSTYDALSHPDRAAWAMVNWPIGVEPVNPAKVLPKYLPDDKADYYVFRSGWSKDGNDWLYASHHGSAYVRGPGIKRSHSFPFVKDQQKLEPLAGGEACAIYGKDHVLVADMTGRSGAPILLAWIPTDAGADAPRQNVPPAVRKMIKKNKRKRRDPQKDPELGKSGARVADRTRVVGAQRWQVATCQSGGAPKLEPTTVDGAPALRAGKRVIVLEDGRVRFDE